MQDFLLEKYQHQFGTSPTHLIRSPGRVNLIGEHTDYNDGFVMPMAINQAIWLALSATNDQRVTAYSVDYDQISSFDLTAYRDEQGGWAEYLKGVAWALTDQGETLQGWQGVIGSDLPIGAGLSSSAALEIAIVLAFMSTSNLSLDNRSMALVAQKAEQRWIRVNCGIMDQLSAVAGVEDHAILIDCRSLELQPIPLPGETMIAILDTGTRRELSNSAYNERRSQCEQAAAFFQRSSLRDVTLEELAGKREVLDSLLYKRALHVLTENQRTVDAAQALRSGDTLEMTRLLNQSHISLRDDYEVSSPALNQMVTCAQAATGCYGARMVGAGFGGCAIALIEAKTAQSFMKEVLQQYGEKPGLKAAIYLTSAANGAEIRSL